MLKFVTYVCIGMLFIMMLLGSADVIGRYIFSKPVTGTFEIFEILLPGIVLLSLGATQAAGAHIRIETFVRYLPPRLRTATDFGTTLLSLAISILILWRGFLIALVYWHQGRVIPNIWVPMFLPRLFVPLGALGLCSALVVQLIQQAAKLRERRLSCPR